MNKLNVSLRLSQVVLTVLSFLLLVVFDINAAITITASVLIFSFITALINKKLIIKGDSINSKTYKALYYALLIPIIIIVLFLCIYGLTSLISPDPVTPSDSILEAFIVMLTGIFFIVLYTQTLIVLIIRKIKR